jgi:hypothetical protein
MPNASTARRDRVVDPGDYVLHELLAVRFVEHFVALTRILWYFENRRMTIDVDLFRVISFGDLGPLPHE